MTVVNDETLKSQLTEILDTDNSTDGGIRDNVHEINTAILV